MESLFTLPRLFQMKLLSINHLCPFMLTGRVNSLLLPWVRPGLRGKERKVNQP